MENFYPNIAYNKSKRRKFLIFFILTALVFASLTALFAIKKNVMLVMIAGFVVLLLLLLFPKVLGMYPTKEVPLISIDKKELVVNGMTLRLSDIISVNCNAHFQASSRESAEIAKELKAACDNPTEFLYLGDCDITIKGKRKEEVVYTTINDVVGALQALVNFGVKKYTLAFSYKKFYEISNYKFVRETTDTMENVSKKERMKQLI